MIVRLKYYYDEPYLPTKCDPQSEHGEGDLFLNKLYAISESAPDATTSGFLALGALANELKESK